MLRVMVHGHNGKMGRAVCALLGRDSGCELVAGIDKAPSEAALAFPTYTQIGECDMPADVIIDFSTADCVPALLDYAVRCKTPLVLCTTGLSAETAAKVEKASSSVAVLRSANMSVGINLLAEVLAKVTETLAGSGFDIEIVERHHNRKVDAPSGTAMLLADEINRAAGGGYDYVYDRSLRREARPPLEIGIHSVRGGTIAGEHSVIFAGQDEVIEFRHEAASREIFAVGAVKAAKFLAGKPAGLYGMKEVIGSI